MTLLAPTAALVAGLLALPAVLALYLLKLRRRPVRVSSTLFWIAASEDLQANVPLRWLRRSWLLLVHLLVALLLVLAIGRPAISGAGAGNRRVIILLDRSASMNARDAGQEPEQTRFELAKRAAMKIASDAVEQDNASVAVIAFGKEPTLLSPATRSTSQLRTVIEAAPPTDQPGDLIAALRAAEAMTLDASESDPPPMVVLVSDGGFAEARATLGNAAFSFVAVGGEPEARPDNVGIVAFAGRREYADPRTVRLVARLVNAGSSAVSVPVALSLDDQVLSRRVVDVPGASVTPGVDGSPATVAPGEMVASLEIETNNAGLLTLSLNRRDALDADNSAWLTIPQGSPPRLTLVVPDALVNAVPDAADAASQSGSPEHAGSGWILADALAEFPGASLTRLTRAQYETRVAERGLPDADLIIFDGVSPAALPRVPTLSFAAIPPMPGVTLSAPSVNGTYVLSWRRTSPILRDVALDSIFVAKPRVIGWNEQTPGVNITELATGGDGPLIAMAEQSGARHLMVAFAPAESDWPLQVGFPVFLAAAIENLTTKAGELNQQPTTSAPLTLRVPASIGVVAMDGPESLRALTRPGDSGSTASFGLVSRAGVYRTHPPIGGSEAVGVSLLDATESSLLTRKELSIGGHAIAAGSASSVGREVWDWCVLAAVVLLVIEWLLYAARMRV